jgi:peptidoglycan/LPS O-acetylase OafA/YrhL
LRTTFTALNGLRIFAALAVVSFHYGKLVDSFQGLPHFLQHIADNGAVGLPFFYVLSGFVLTHAYHGRGPNEEGKKADFYTARFARLFPAYLLSFLLFLPMAAEKFLWHPSAPQHRDVHTFVWGGVLTFFALQAWTPLSQAWNAPAWSLSVEVFFYFLFPFVLPKIIRMRPTRLVLLLGTLWLAMISLTIAHELNVIRPEAWHRYFMYQPLFWLPTFLIGIATYRLATRWRWAPDAWATAVSIGSLSLLVTLSGWLPPERGDFLVNGGAAPLIALIVLAFSHPRCLSSRLMGGRVLSFLGGASYGIYILQDPIWHIWKVASDTLRHAGSHNTATGWQFFLYLALLGGIAILVQQTLEKPAQRWLWQRRATRMAPRGSQSNREVAA